MTINVLKSKPSGTWLMRFSTSPGCYSVTVNNAGNVNHWRITSKKENGKLVCVLNDKKYDGIVGVIKVHIVEPLHVSHLVLLTWLY
jgi:hypothetical protein